MKFESKGFNILFLKVAHLLFVFFWLLFYFWTSKNYCKPSIAIPMGIKIFQEEQKSTEI